MRLQQDIQAVQAALLETTNNKPHGCLPWIKMWAMLLLMFLVVTVGAYPAPALQSRGHLKEFPEVGGTRRLHQPSSRTTRHTKLQTPCLELDNQIKPRQRKDQKARLL